MDFFQLKEIALRKYPQADTCYDCGGVLHFVCEDSDEKGAEVTLVKETGESTSYVMAIEDGLVTLDGVRLNFETGEPV